MIISNLIVHNIHEAALEAILKYNDTSLNAASIVMMLNKDGLPKDVNETWAFMRRVAIIREEVRATSSDSATERVEQVTSSDNATERVQLDTHEVSLCSRRFGCILLTVDLLLH